MQPWKLEPAHDHGLPLSQRLLSLRRESGLVETVARFGWWSLVRGYLTLAHRLTIHGGENLPGTLPFVMVGNHTSHLDAMVLAAQVPWRLRDHVFPIAAGDTFFTSSAVALFSVGALNALPMWRKSCGPHALQELRGRLVDEPCGYILFPEGTRSRDGQLLPFKAGLGMLIAGTKVPVIPCRINGAFEAMPPHRVLPRLRRITLNIGPALDFSTLSNDRPGWDAIGRQTEDAVRRLALVENNQSVPE